MLMRTSQKKSIFVILPVTKFHYFPQLFSTYHQCKSQLPNDLPTEIVSYTYICIQLPSYHLCFLFSSSSLINMFLLTCALCQCVYASSDCDQKKNTLYHNFLGNLNFKNIIIFFKRTCCTLITPSKTILRATSEPFDIFSTKISSFAEFTFYMVIHSLEPSPPPFFKGGE